MDLKTLISLILPGESDSYRSLGLRLGCTGAAVHAWDKNGTMPMLFVEKLINEPGHEFKLADFRPHSKELDSFLCLIEKEAG